MTLRSLLFALLLPMAANAGETPKEGDDKYTHTLVVTSSSLMKVGERALIISEQNGISLNDNGGGMFNDMGTRCISLEEIIGSERHAWGGCTFTDKDGDQIMLSLDRRGNTGNASGLSRCPRFAHI